MYYGGGAAHPAANWRLYDVLGLPRSATQEDVRKAYRRLALLHHPDRGGDAAQFRAVAEAYEILNDPVRRQRYDLLGDVGLQGHEPGPGHSTWADTDGAFGNLFGGGFGGGAAPPRRQRTQDRVCELVVTLEELYSGATRRVALEREVPNFHGGQEICPVCSGSGLMVNGAGASLCIPCAGRGLRLRMRLEQQILEVVIDRGAVDGQRVVVPRQGDQHPGCDPGDVVFVLREQPHKEFRRQKADLYIQRRITLLEALVGFTLEVRHLDGRRLRIQPKPGRICGTRGFPWPSEAAWRSFQDTDSCPGEDAGEVMPMDLDACRLICLQRGFGGFVAREGYAHFRAARPQDLLQRKVAQPGSTLHVAPDLQMARSVRLQQAVRGEGMPCTGNPLARGNLFVLLSVLFPGALSTEASGLLCEVLGGAAANAARKGEDLEERQLQDVTAADIEKLTAGAAAGGADDGPDECRQQ